MNKGEYKSVMEKLDEKESKYSRKLEGVKTAKKVLKAVFAESKGTAKSATVSRSEGSEPSTERTRSPRTETNLHQAQGTKKRIAKAIGTAPRKRLSVKNLIKKVKKANGKAYSKNSIETYVGQMVTLGQLKHSKFPGYYEVK